MEIPDITPDKSLYSRILNRDGTIALIAVALLIFFFTVYWNVLQHANMVHEQMLVALNKNLIVSRRICIALTHQSCDVDTDPLVINNITSIAH